MRPVSKSLKEYARGVAGGLLFSLPLLYTIEVWWFGVVARPERLLLYVCATFVLLLGYNYFVGLRRDSCFSEVAIDSVEEMGLGLLLAAGALWALGRITAEMTAAEIVGVTVVEAMTVAIGVSVGTAQLGGKDDGDKGEAGDGGGGEDKGVSGGRKKVSFAGQLVIAGCGAMLFAANVAPTEEIVQIAIEIAAWRLLGLALLSLSLAALILYYSEFAGAQKHVRFDRRHDVLVGAVVTYAAALVVSALMLWFFGRFEGASLAVAVGQTVVLGVG
ncbi:MAG: TIGR02587 family membrane protein, partial [Pyrinomonadaceae bacterium]